MNESGADRPNLRLGGTNQLFDSFFFLIAAAELTSFRPRRADPVAKSDGREERHAQVAQGVSAPNPASGQSFGQCIKRVSHDNRLRKVISCRPQWGLLR